MTRATKSSPANVSAAHLAAVVEFSDDAIFSKSLDGIILSWNRGAELMYGYGRQEIVGRSVAILLPPDRPHEVRDILARLRRGEHIGNMETVRQRSDGTRLHVLLTMSPIRDPDGEIVAASTIARDITERVRAEQAMRRLAAELEDRVALRTRELKAINEELEAFAHTVAHDLRAPLITITGFARILLEDHGSSLDEDARRRLEAIAGNAHRMGDLIDGLLTFARLGRRAMSEQPADPAAVARQAWAELDGVRSGREVELVIGDLPSCRADEVLLKQVFVNLLSNALKFTRGRPRARIEVGWRRDQGEGGGHNVYFVRDNGAGFDMQYAHKLFRIFQRLHSTDDFEGTGIGLATVQRVIARHGGQVWAEGETGKGATFFFTLREGGP